jgi:hypothetical protein
LGDTLVHSHVEPMTSQRDGGTQAANSGTADDYGFHDDWFSVQESQGSDHSP